MTDDRPTGARADELAVHLTPCEQLLDQKLTALCALATKSTDRSEW